MAARWRVGVLGLGGAWPRYRAALAGRRSAFAVRAVCDPAAARAEAEARRLGCAPAGGVAELLARDDVDAVLLPGGPWYGLWPLGRACEAGKPVLCAAPLLDDTHADAVCARVREARLPVLLAPAPRLALLAEQLRRRLGGALGAVRGVRVDRTRGGGLDGALPLLQACAALLGGPPRAVTAAGAPGFVSLALEFDGGVGQVTLWGWGGRPRCRLEVLTERGRAAAAARRLTVADAEGRHTFRLPAEAPEAVMLGRFARALAGEAAPAPGFEEGCAALAWLRAARRSLAEGRRVPIAAPG